MARVLVADDVIDIAEMLQQAFIKNGHEVEICFNGRDAIKKLQTGEFDLIITDVVMPDIDGLELSKYIRHKLNKNVPIIAISGGGYYISRDVAISAAQIHADMVLHKPFSLRDLESAAAALLSAEKLSCPG